MSIAAPLQIQAAKPKPLDNSTSAGLLLQRKCSCGSPTASLTGECAECKSKKRLQTRLSIGASNDPLEREADRVADQVTAVSAHSAVRGARRRIQRYAGQATEGTNAAPASVDRVLASSGRRLEPTLQQDMEQRFGHDFSRVRVHSGAAAEQSAREVNADAYTVEHNIVFGAGQFAPNVSEGRKLLAHELAHVVQQRAASNLPGSLCTGAAGDGYTQVAKGMTARTDLRETTLPNFVLQRQPAHDAPREQGDGDLHCPNETRQTSSGVRNGVLYYCNCCDTLTWGNCEEPAAKAQKSCMENHLKENPNLSPEDRSRWEKQCADEFTFALQYCLWRRNKPAGECNCTNLIA